MVGVLRRTCLREGSKVRLSSGTVGTKFPLYCKQHTQDGMTKIAGEQSLQAFGDRPSVVAGERNVN